MATLLIHDNFTQDEKRLLHTSFKSHAQELGIHSRDFTVTLRKEDLEKRNRFGIMTKAEPGHFITVLNEEGFNLSKAISVLGHELVHVRQYLLGHLTDDPMGTSTCWKGRNYPAFICQLCYNDLPWEKEAFALQPKLHRKALEKLPDHERRKVLASRHPDDPDFLDRET